MLTAMGEAADRIAGLESGADDYLAKPFDFDELLARLESLSRRGREVVPVASARLVVGDLVFDRERMQASRSGQILALTARELALLELMMSAPGRLFSRERILSNVWGASEDPLTNVVDVYIRRLRTNRCRQVAAVVEQPDLWPVSADPLSTPPRTSTSRPWPASSPPSSRKAMRSPRSR